MQGFEIGLSGLDVASKALDIIGNNVANAATEGYHRQRLDLNPGMPTFDGSIAWGGGVEISGVTRILDEFLEQEIMRQESFSGQISQELTSLHTIENTFGEFGGGSSLSATIDDFFNAIHDLASHPSEITWQQQLITAAESMCNQFRVIGTSLTEMSARVITEGETIIDRINELSNEIADINGKISRIEIAGGTANNLRDQRDQLITDMSRIIGVQIREEDYGVVNVTVAGIPVVMGTLVTDIELGYASSTDIGVGVAGGSIFSSNVSGGTLGGLVSTKNDILNAIQTDLDALAKTIVQQVNDIHVQGIGSAGPFSELTGWTVSETATMADLEPAVSTGTLQIRVTDSSGNVTRTAVTINTTDQLADVQASIDAVSNISASIVSGKLRITADSGYTFDFIPAPLPTPTAESFAGSGEPTITVSGIYNESTNQTFLFTVSGTGSVGNGSLDLVVTSGGSAVTTLNIGSGYVAGNKLDLGNGIKITLSIGDLTNGDTFEVDAFADTDTAGVLAALGINTMLYAVNAKTMAVCSDISDTPGRLATSLGSDHADNTNALNLSNLKDTTHSDLDNQSIDDYYHAMATSIGLDVSVKEMRQDNIEASIKNLTTRRSDASGVDINDEAARMLLYEQMYQAMAKYLNTLNTSLMTIMDLL